MLRRATAAACLAALALAGCGDDGSSSADQPAGSSSAPTSAAQVAPTTGAPAPATTAAATSPTTPPPNANVKLAQQALLGQADVPQGWIVAPRGPDKDDDNPLAALGPECATLASLETDPALQDETAVALGAPKGGATTQTISHQVTVGDAAAIQKAQDAVMAPEAEPCFEKLFQSELGKQQLPAGVQVGPVDLTPKQVAVGDQSAAYTGTLNLSGPGGQLSFALELEVVRVRNAMSQIASITLGPTPVVDPAAMAQKAADKMAALPQ